MGPSYIANLRGMDGILVSDSTDIQQVMIEFYRTPYLSRLALTPTQIATYLRDIPLSEWSDAQRVSSLANNKSPGVDGLPNKIYGKI